jgi:hypothetical protein
MKFIIHASFLPLGFLETDRMIPPRRSSDIHQHPKEHQSLNECVYLISCSVENISSIKLCAKQILYLLRIYSGLFIENTIHDGV